MRALPLGLMLTAILISGASAQLADTILTNGKVLTVDPAFTIAEAVAIGGGRILAVGKASDVSRHAGPNTLILDMAGRTVIPGLIDSHIHVVDPGVTYSIEVSWAGVPTLAAALQLVRDAAERTTPGSWVAVIGGWDEFQFAEKRRPTPAELQAAAPNHAVYVQHLFDWAALNSLAMDKLKLSQGVTLPAGGEVQTSPDGKATGVVTGNTGTFLTLVSKVPKPTFDKEAEGIREYLNALARVGLTGIVDADGRSPVAPHYGPLLKLWQDRRLPLRVAYYVQATHGGEELADYQHYTRLLTTGFGDEMLKFNGIGEVLIWGMHDGGCCGQLFNSDEQSRESLYHVGKWAAENRLSIQIHATTDRSAGQILNIFERINGETPITSLRWMIAHIEDASTQTLERMKRLGIAWAVQHRLYFKGDEYLKKDPSAARRAPPIKTALKMGLLVAAGTDAPRVAPFNPFICLAWLLDGKSISGAEIRTADESPDREEALRMYTMNGAWVTHDEESRGSIEAGKFADLVVLDRDFLTVPIGEISQTKVLLTMLGGKIIHAADPYRAPKN